MIVRVVEDLSPRSEVEVAGILTSNTSGRNQMLGYVGQFFRRIKKAKGKRQRGHGQENTGEKTLTGLVEVLPFHTKRNPVLFVSGM